MKPSTVKQPIQPKIDHDQGQNLFVKLFEKIFSSGSSLVEKVKISRHADQNRCQNSGTFIRKIKAKKKRRRKIAYQSKIETRFPGKKKIRI